MLSLRPQKNLDLPPRTCEHVDTSSLESVVASGVHTGCAQQEHTGETLITAQIHIESHFAGRWALQS